LNPFAANVEWGSLATLVAGVSAIAGAVFVASKQNAIRRDELRIALFNHRKLIIDEFYRLEGEWTANAALSSEGVRSFSKLVKDIELLFEAGVWEKASQLFSDTVLHGAFEKVMTAYAEGRDPTKYTTAAEKAGQRFDRIIENMPKLRELLVKHTKLGHI